MWFGVGIPTCKGDQLSVGRIYFVFLICQRLKFEYRFFSFMSVIKRRHNAALILRLSVSSLLVYKVTYAPMAQPGFAYGGGWAREA
jgi:hypothetical protein